MAKFESKDVDSYLAQQYSRGDRPVTPKVQFPKEPNSAASQQLQLQNQKDIDHLNQMIAERDEELKKVFMDAQEVNKLFHTVSTTIHQQGVAVDNIANNITHASNNVHRATDTLKKADEEDKNNNLPYLIGGISVAGVVGAVVGAVILL